MFGLVINIFKGIISVLLKLYQPQWLLRFDAWLEKRLGIDLIKQEKKFHEKYPGIMNRIQLLEKDSHPKCGIEEFDGYATIDKRIEDLEKKVK